MFLHNFLWRYSFISVGFKYVHASISVMQVLISIATIVRLNKI